jgi:hypothetical protein
MVSLPYVIRHQAKEMMCILEYDAQAQSMVTKVSANLSGSTNRPPSEVRGCLDPECRSVFMFLFAHSHAATEVAL